jgi:hypothetical protein
MRRGRRLSLVTASVIAALAVAVSAAAQGKSASAPGKTKKSTPPSSSSLPGTTAAVGASPLSTATGASPLSWVDDATLLDPGSALLTFSVMRWSGAGASEVDAPIFDAAFGLTPRLQFSASIPHVVGSADEAGAIGGLGTSYFSAKIALLNDSKVKVAVSPLVEILGTGAARSLPEEESRYQVGVPITVEVGQGAARVFGVTGFFSRGAWFAGGGTAIQLAPRVGASVSLTRSWATMDVDGVQRNRSELSGGVSYFLKPQIAVYGSLAHTIATAEENGAGLSMATGVTFVLASGLTTSK